MKTACQVFDSDQKLLMVSPSDLLILLKHPENWTWFKVKYSTSIAYAQDPVHVCSCQTKTKDDKITQLQYFTYW